MPGFLNTSVPSINVLQNVTNVSSPAELLININSDLFGGLLFFILLFTLWVILYIISVNIDNNFPVESAMYTGAIVSVISFFLRAIYVYQNGVFKGLLTDVQLWIFPILTTLLAMIVWFNKRD